MVWDREVGERLGGAGGGGGGEFGVDGRGVGGVCGVRGRGGGGARMGVGDVVGGWFVNTEWAVVLRCCELLVF